jgi:hypothetical protein
MQNRRNLSGIYFFHKFDEDDNIEPTCFEDCPTEKQDEILDMLDSEAVKRLAKQLASTLREIGDYFTLMKE